MPTTQNNYTLEVIRGVVSWEVGKFLTETFGFSRVGSNSSRQIHFLIHFAPLPAYTWGVMCV